MVKNLKGADWVAPDCAGMNFFSIDKGLQSGGAVYLPNGFLSPRVRWRCVAVMAISTIG
jgi:hypothetical protein